MYVPCSQAAFSLSDEGQDLSAPPPPLVRDADAAGSAASSPRSRCDSLLPSTEDQTAAINAYFRCCHNQPYAYFNEDSFRRRFIAGELPAYLILVVMATAARFGDQHDRLRAYAESAWLEILQLSLGGEGDASPHLVSATSMLAAIDFPGEIPRSRTPLLGTRFDDSDRG